MKNTSRIPIEIKINPYINDHHFLGRTVIPAVELCQTLADNIKKVIPDAVNTVLSNASFEKFIDVKNNDPINAFNDIDISDSGIISSRLYTKTKAGKSGITRTNEHLRLVFKKYNEAFLELPYDIASAIEGNCLRIPAEKIYDELVPFGDAYRNISGILYISESGAIAEISSPPEISAGPLGSPFVFDAALHAASVWGQRYNKVVGFPVAFGKRIIVLPAERNQKYTARIIPKHTDPNILTFDIWIYDDNGKLREAGFDIILRDVSGGKMKPPEWILYRKNNYLQNISLKCDGISVIELDTIAGFADKALSVTELQRLEPMMDRRRKTYFGARLACKYLSRKLSKAMQNIPADQINTVKDKIYPVCPTPDGSIRYNCSVSHDSRFAVAVASKRRIGIDVEEISETVVKAGRMYMSDREKKIVDSAGLKIPDASLRVWSIKEAVTKALDLELSRSWEKVNVVKIGENSSVFLINNLEITANHSNVDDHLFTLVLID